MGDYCQDGSFASFRTSVSCREEIAGSNPAKGMHVRLKCVLRDGRGPCDGLITGSGEFYRVCVFVRVCVCLIVCDLETSRVRWPRAELGYTEKGNTLPLFF
jgi:hypothetical protein